jgi:hypothetical protein
VKQPPEFCTGSRKTAATVSAPSNRIASSIRSAAQRPNATGSSASSVAEAVGVGHPKPPGASGSKSFFMFGSPVMARAPCGVPWYATARLITLCLSGLPTA